MIDLLRIVLALAERIAALTSTAIDDKLVAIAKAVSENQALLDLLIGLIRPESAGILAGQQMPVLDSANAAALESAGLAMTDLISLAKWLVRLAKTLGIDLPSLVLLWASLPMVAESDDPIPDGV